MYIVYIDWNKRIGIIDVDGYWNPIMNDVSITTEQMYWNIRLLRTHHRVLIIF